MVMLVTPYPLIQLLASGNTVLFKSYMYISGLIIAVFMAEIIQEILFSSSVKHLQSLCTELYIFLSRGRILGRNGAKSLKSFPP